MRPVWDDYRSLEQGPASVVCMGNFDGVHRGHQSVFEKTFERAKRQRLKSYLVTFEPHPAHVLNQTRNLDLLLSGEERREVLSLLPFDGLLFQRFDRPFSQITAEEFIRDVLKWALNAEVVIVGQNFRFGFEARGNVEVLRANTGLEVEAGPLVTDPEGRIISSTLIREELKRGEVDQAAIHLGYPYFATGTVVHGEGRGRRLGIPTANVQTSKKLVLPTGVYSGIAERVDTGERYRAAINFGSRPTFDGEGLALEVHLLDFDGDLYGRGLRVHFLSRLRGEKKFNKMDELMAQVGEDREAVRGLVRLDTPLLVEEYFKEIWRML